MRKFRATVKMKKSWATEFPKKPSLDNVLEAFADTILQGVIDEIFEISIEKTRESKRRSQLGEQS